jgi:hypothetical protein
MHSNTSTSSQSGSFSLVIRKSVWRSSPTGSLAHACECRQSPLFFIPALIHSRVRSPFSCLLSLSLFFHPIVVALPASALSLGPRLLPSPSFPYALADDFNREQTSFSMQDVERPDFDISARAKQLGRTELFAVCGDSEDDELPEGVKLLDCKHVSLGQNAVNSMHQRLPESCIASSHMRTPISRHYLLAAYLLPQPRPPYSSYVECEKKNRQKQRQKRKISARRPLYGRIEKQVCS